MYIKRVQIEEGFLHGLDIELSRGLNVLIGARGTGKTSLIELIRFCLGVPGNTAETSRRSKEHALSVLGSGQVTVTLSDASQEIVVTRSASDEGPRSAVEFPRPAIFSQTEIENIGLQASGRLLLVDGFSAQEMGRHAAEQQAVAEFSSLNVEVEKLRRELDDLDRQLAEMPSVLQQLAANAADQNTIAHHSAVMAAKAKELEGYSAQIAAKAVVTVEGTRVVDGLGRWYGAVKAGLDAAPVFAPSSKLPVVEVLNTQIVAIQSQLQESLNAIGGAYHQVKNAVDLESASKVQLEDTARQVRKEVETLSQGSGLVLRRGQQLQEQHARLLALGQYQAARREALEKLLLRRTAALDKLDTLRERRYAARAEAVKTLNKLLGPRIRVALMRNAQIYGFSSAIAEALKGSGLRYSDIATAIAENLSPRALLSAIDSFDQELIAQVAEISGERAARALTHLRATDLGSLGTTDVDDEASFQLLDGKDYKDFNELSTGQRCTVVLPMVLAHRDKIIIVDQPEDHIDNAFIADTLIKVILKRDPNGQILFSTHNPNIPVLGNAELVVQLGSDGRHGFILARGALESPTVVEAVSNVMEGGAEAFARRSAFYAQIVHE